MRYMLDTNICIYAIKNKPEMVLHHLESLNPSDVCISSVTYAELAYGVEKSSSVERNRLALLLMLVNIDIEPFDSGAAEEYGKIRADLERGGNPIGPYDMMIAGHALSLGCVLVTNNMREFERVEGLTIENWVQ